MLLSTSIPESSSSAATLVSSFLHKPTSSSWSSSFSKLSISFDAIKAPSLSTHNTVCFLSSTPLSVSHAFLYLPCENENKREKKTRENNLNFEKNWWNFFETNRECWFDCGARLGNLYSYVVLERLWTWIQRKLSNTSTVTRNAILIWIMQQPWCSTKCLVKRKLVFSIVLRGE